MDNYLRDAYGESRFKWVEFQVPSNRGNECVPGVLAEVRGTVGCVSASLDTSGGLGRLLVQVHAGEVEGVCAVLGRKFSMVGVLDPVDGTV